MRYRTLTAAAAVVALAAAGCDTAQDPTIGGSPSPTDAATTATQTSDPGPSPEGTTETAAGAERIEVTVSGGEVDGPGTVAVDVGAEVELVVTSDVADHVHVHGYDLFQDVAAGETVTLPFTADIPGVFEVELEESATHLLDLEVRG